MSRSPLDPLLAVRTNGDCPDPAIDRRASNLLEYQRTREAKHLVYKDSLQPALFVLQPIARKFEAVALSSNENLAFRAEIAFRACCHEIRLPDGSKLTAQRLVDGAFDTRMADDDWLDQVKDEFGAATVREMGQVAIERARLPKGAQGPFSLPGTL